MNERFGVDPKACEGAVELRYLLEKFGPYHGRYVAQYPPSWFENIRKIIDAWPEIERARGYSVLRRAKERRAVVRDTTLPYDSHRNWLENVLKVARPSKGLDGAVVRRAWAGTFPSVDDLDLPPTSEELIAPRVSEYVRVSRALLAISPELVLIDAYLDVTRKDQADVVCGLLQAARGGACRHARIFAKAREQRSLDDIPLALARIKRQAQFSGPLELMLVDDAWSNDELHARYLLSIHGAIRLDRGFQVRAERKLVDVSVVGKAVHEGLIERYLESRGDFQITTRFAA